MFDSIFSERGLSLERLRVLIEVHDAGSIARTSPGDAVRHSQYSRQVRELSEFFGCELTHRRGKVLKLTAEGTRLAELARPLLRGIEDFRAECRSERTAFVVAAGDSLIQWLVIPRLGDLMKNLPHIRFNTLSLRTHEIVQQVSDLQVDFGLIRKNAIATGMKSAALGRLTYVAVVPAALASGKRIPTFSEVLREFPLAMQITDGQFTTQLRNIALSEDVSFRPALCCQSFPQTLAAVRSGRFAAIIPDLAIRELPSGFVHSISDPSLRNLERDIFLVWNPRIIKVRPHAPEVVAEIQATFRLS